MPSGSSRTPLRVMENVRDLRDTRAEAGASKRRLAARVVSLPGGFFAAGRVYASRADAEAAASRLSED